MDRLRVLVGCEMSRTVAAAFERRGHFAVSCDLQAAMVDGRHYRGDVFDLIEGLGGRPWDLAIFHPPCTYLCNSGVRWLYQHGRPEPVRWAQMEAAARFFRRLLEADIPRVAVENPIMHRYAREIVGRPPDQILQPWQYGHGETKATCLWLRGLRPLVPSSIVAGREARIHRMSPGPDRGLLRSLTYPGIAEAMAAQWS